LTSAKAINNKKNLSVGDLFAGAGGLAVGFHLAGFHPVFFNEIDEQAAATFHANFPRSTPFVCPIEDLTGEIIRTQSQLDGDEMDVMVGGPPCQGFSINAPTRSETDPRNHLFRHYVRLVLEGIRPKFVVMENVPGLLSLENGKVLRNVIAAFEQAKYKVAFKILNAAHYGVPQERWRLIFVGTRLRDVSPSFPTPTHYSLQRANFTGGSEFTFTHAIGAPAQGDLFFGKLKPPSSVREAIGDLPPIKSGGGKMEMAYDRVAESDYQRMMRKGAGKLYNHECVGLSSINFQRLKYIKPGGSWRDIPHHLLPRGLQRARRSDHTRRYGRLNPNTPSCTIMTKCDPHWGTFIHYRQNRIISVREAARIQSFPDWFQFTGSKNDQYRQVGNAVPPLLAWALARHIKELILKSEHARESPRKESLAYAASER